MNGEVRKESGVEKRERRKGSGQEGEEGRKRKVMVKRRDEYGRNGGGS